MDYGIRSGKILSLGIPKEPQGNIKGIPKQLSLGMPRMASPLSSSFIGNLTWSYIFIHHMICVLLGASFYFTSIYLLLFRVMFCIFSFNKNVKDSVGGWVRHMPKDGLSLWEPVRYRRCLETGYGGDMHAGGSYPGSGLSEEITPLILLVWLYYLVFLLSSERV